MPSISLTKDQQEAKDKFIQFLLSDEQEFYLFGPAGSGKSFLIRHLGSYCFSNDYKNLRKILGLPVQTLYPIYTATTNKAAAVLGEFLKEEVDTVFKKFHLKVNENFLLGTTEISQEEPAKPDGNIYFIDECSMLSQEALELIRNSCRGRDTKLVFIGDNNQLAPVGEKPYWNNTPEFNTAYLCTAVRNKNHKALMDLCEQLKQTVLTGQFKDIQIVPGVIDYVEDEDTLDLVKDFEAFDDIILSFTNERVDKCMQSIQEIKPELKNETRLINANHYVVNYVPGTSDQTTPAFYPEEKVVVKRKLSPTRIYITYNSAPIEVDRYDIYSECIGTHRCFVLPGSKYQELLKQFSKAKKWKEYFYVKNGTMVLRLPHACTIHKAQGSTFRKVFIDLTSFKWCKDKEMLARLLYVAVSRAKDHIYLSGSLPKQFGRILK